MAAWKRQLSVCSVCRKPRFPKTFENPERPDVCKYCDTHKICGGTAKGKRKNGCGRFLPKDMFHKGKQPDGREIICKDCVNRALRAKRNSQAESERLNRKLIQEFIEARDRGEVETMREYMKIKEKS